MTDTPTPPLQDPPPDTSPALRPANENPWYVLATLHGEQSKQLLSSDFDKELHSKNRLAWNRFIAGLMDEKEIVRTKMLKNADGSPRFSEEELTPYDKNGRARIMRKFRKRAAKKSILLPHGKIDFQNTVFTEPFVVENFILFGNVDFSNAIFSHKGDVNFTEAIFFGIVNFSNVKFQSITHFDGVSFLNHAIFLCTKFLYNTHFTDANFLNHAVFSSTVFSGRSIFTNTKFGSLTSFEGAKFDIFPPKFHGATLHEGTRWNNVKWPNTIEDSEIIIDHIENYERIKFEMEKLKKHEDEIFFFVKEMKCREIRDRWPKNQPSKLYKLLSDYGTSIAKPLKGLAMTWALCAIAYQTLTTLPMERAVAFSAASLFDALGARKNFFETEMKSMSGLVAIIASLETALGLVFLFLLGLALRNRFRMK